MFDYQAGRKGSSGGGLGTGLTLGGGLMGGTQGTGLGGGECTRLYIYFRLLLFAISLLQGFFTM